MTRSITWCLVSVGLVAALVGGGAVRSQSVPTVEHDFAAEPNYTAGVGWAGPWIESDDDGDPFGGAIFLDGGTSTLQVGQDGGPVRPSIRRSVDLSGFTSTGATLRGSWFPYLDVEMKTDGDSFAVVSRGAPTAPLSTRSSGAIFPFVHDLEPGMLRADGEVRIVEGAFAADGAVRSLGFGVPVGNPDLPRTCGLDIILVLDESSSIGSAGASDDVRAAVEALASGIVGAADAVPIAGYDARMQIVEFASEGRNASVGGDTGLRIVDQPYIDGPLRSYLYPIDNPPNTDPTNYSPGGQTNWADALQLASLAIGDARAPLVVFVTDGAPNWLSSLDGSRPAFIGGLSRDVAAANAAVQIELIKAAGAHVIGVAVGAATERENLARVEALVEPDDSTRQVWDGTGELDITEVDVIMSEQFETFEDRLAAFAATLCVPELSMTKAAVGGDVEVHDDGSYSSSYVVDVVNEGGVPTSYTLADAPGFTPGATIGAIDVELPGGTTVDLPPGGGTIVTDAVIDADATDRYTVTVTFDLAAATPLDERVCDGAGSATFNSATLTYSEGTIDDDGCIPLPEPDVSITKTVATGPTANPDGTYTITYSIVVDGAAGAGPTVYDLIDATDFSAGVEIVSRSVANAAPGDIDVDDAFDATGVIATDQPIDGGTTHAYVVTVQVARGTSFTSSYSPCSGTDGQAGAGLYNRATLTHDDTTLVDDACGDVPPSTTTIAAAPPTLPRTGPAPVAPVTVALGALGFGAVLLVAARRGAVTRPPR
jgi:hypothetical protein